MESRTLLVLAVFLALTFPIAFGAAALERSLNGDAPVVVQAAPDTAMADATKCAAWLSANTQNDLATEYLIDSQVKLKDIIERYC